MAEKKAALMEGNYKAVENKHVVEAVLTKQRKLAEKKDRAIEVLADVQEAVDQGAEPYMDLPKFAVPTAEERAAADFDQAAFLAQAIEEFQPKALEVLKARGQDAPAEREATEEEKAADDFDEEKFKLEAQVEFPVVAMTMLLKAKNKTLERAFEVKEAKEAKMRAKKQAAEAKRR